MRCKVKKQRIDHNTISTVIEQKSDIIRAAHPPPRRNRREYTLSQPAQLSCKDGFFRVFTANVEDNKLINKSRGRVEAVVLLEPGIITYLLKAKVSAQNKLTTIPQKDKN